MSKNKNKGKEENQSEENPPVVEETEETKETPVEETKTEEKADSSSITLAQGVSQLKEKDKKELLEIVRMNLVAATQNKPVEHALSMIAASILKRTGLKREGLQIDTPKFHRIYPKIKGIWNDSTRKAENKLEAIAACFE